MLNGNGNKVVGDKEGYGKSGKRDYDGNKEGIDDGAKSDGEGNEEKKLQRTERAMSTMARAMVTAANRARAGVAKAMATGTKKGNGNSVFVDPNSQFLLVRCQFCQREVFF
jgi:hypothetical protein